MNNAELHSSISKLLIDRQDKGKATDEHPDKKPEYVGSVEELKKYKELLDGGIITKEEFEAKKKQIMGL